ncbi:MAG: ROK family protein, partial [Oscillospiraceae bacterium]
MSYYIGVDLGGTNIAAALVDENCKIISRAECKTDLPRPEVLVENDIAMLCYQLLANNNLTKNDIAWIGIGTPGSVNATRGIVGFNANFGYHNWQLKTNIEKLTDITVYIENDANAAAYGEYMAGALKNADTAIAITLGTGIGGG